MSLFSFLGRKKKQESTSTAPGFTSRSEEESQAYRNRGRKNPDNASQKSPAAALPEKKRARRRLIGAIALVLAAIIGLPMLLDSGQKSIPDDIAIQIPSMDTPLPASDSHPASGGASSSGVVSAAAADGLGQQEEIIEPAQAPATGNAITQTKPEPAPPPPREAKTAPKTAVQPKSESKPESKPESKSEPKHEPKPEPKLTPEPGTEPKNSVKIDEAARARAILEGGAETAVPQKTSAKVTLQVAALATQEKVDELQGKLKDAGIASYTQKVATQSGTRIRVRVGPFAGKEDAEKMRARLVQLGYGGTIVPAH